MGTSLKLLFNNFLEPQVEYIVEINVCEEGRYYASLCKVNKYAK